MARARLSAIVDWCDHTLRISEVQDYDRASNGLQVQNHGSVSRIAAAVDASLATVKLAVAAKADLLVVHHGLFWGPTHPWTGKRYELLQALLQGDLAVYSAHLPLDLHPKLGNNVLLARSLGLKQLKPFFHDRGQHLGVKSASKIHRDKLSDLLRKGLGTVPLLIPGGPEVCRRIGVVTGGAGAELAKAAREGIDTFITGEGPHWTFALAEELGINVFYGGHYATETFGVKALAAELSRRFQVPWQFVDHPTGL